MNLEIIAKLIMLMENSSLSTLEVENNGLRVRMESDQASWGANNKQEVKQVDPNLLKTEVSQALAADTTAVESYSDSDEEQAMLELVSGDKEITSPMVGTFHELKNHPIEIGTKLKAGDTVCIIEAMKVMNEIVIEEDGVITWIACSEGDMAEYGQVLFRYRLGE